MRSGMLLRNVAIATIGTIFSVSATPVFALNIACTFVSVSVSMEL